MKKDGKHGRLVLLESLGEVLLTLLCLGIGIFIVSLFGVNFKSHDMDYDLIILLGLVSFFFFHGFWMHKCICSMAQKNN